MLINLRNALMTGKRLPYDAEVEYLESTGMQYVDTGVIAGDDTTFSVRFNCTSTNDTAIYGGRSQSQDRQWILPLQINQIQFGYGSIYQNINVQYRGNWLNIDTSLSAESYTYKVTTDGGVETLMSTPRQSFTNTAHILLFAAWNNTAVGYKTIAKVAKFQIWKNGVLVRDYIPVRVGTVGYLYDRVSGRLFGNAGTGDFVLGPDVVPVEYIESHGTEYIDSGFDITNAQSFAYDVKFSIAQSVSNTQPRLLSNEGAGAGNYYDIYFSNNVLRVRQANVAVNNAQRDTPIVAKMTEQGRYYGYYESTPDALLWDATRTFTSPAVKVYYRIFCRGNDGQAQYRWQGKAWYMRFWKDGVPIRSFRPVRVGSGSTWEGALLDTVTRRIYRNAGTGAFGYGNDLKYPIPSE